MRGARYSLLLLVVISATGMHGQAKVSCVENDTPLSCWLKFNPDVADATQDAVNKANTGSTTVTSLTATALKDFLAVFAASVDSAAVSEKGNAITLDWNLPFPIVDAKQRSMKLQAVFTKPDASDAVSSALTSNAAELKKLNDSLSNTDDIATSLTYSPVNQRVGRSVTPHLVLFRAMNDSIDLRDSDAKDEALLNVLKSSPEIKDQKTPFSAITDLKRRAEAVAAMQNAADSAQAVGKVRNTLVLNFAHLLNNQPQVYGSAVYHRRKNVVGPDTVSGKFTYEFGSSNLNYFRARDNHQCDGESVVQNGAACMQKLADFVEKNGGLDHENAPRLAVSLEYQHSSEDHVNLTGTTPAVTVPDSPHTHSVIGSLTYGRSITQASGRDGRLDVSASYENVSNDPKKKDRFVGSITFTEKITDTMSLPLSLIYANHSQFLSNVNRKLNVHFGLSYKLPDLRSVANN